MEEMQTNVDDPILQLGLLLLWEWSDTTYENGFKDGLLGVQIRPIPEDIPPVYQEFYLSGYKAGALERERRLDVSEMRLLLEARGVCSVTEPTKTNHSDPCTESGISTVGEELNVASPQWLPTTLDGRDENMQQGSQAPNPGQMNAWKKYGKPIIGALVIACGGAALGFAVGKKVGTEQKRSLGTGGEGRA